MAEREARSVSSLLALLKPQDGETEIPDARKTGKVIPFSDLLIGATALHHGYAVGTRNLRHFRMIPDLTVFTV